MTLLSFAERSLVSLLLLTIVVSPLTRDFAAVFSLSQFESTSVWEMTIYLVQRIFPSLYHNALLFLVPPFFFLLFRLLLFLLPEGISFFSWVKRLRLEDRLQILLCWVSMALSFVLLPLLLSPTDGRKRGAGRSGEENYMANLFTADLLLMGAFHVYLVYRRVLPAPTLAGGPLFGLSLFLHLPPGKRESSLPLSLLFLYVCIGSLYKSFLHFETETGKAILIQNVPFSDWYGYELYSLFTIAAGFLLLSASIPLPLQLLSTSSPSSPSFRSFFRPSSLFLFFLQTAEILVYIVLLNANVAAAWAWSSGVWRQPLQQAAYRIRIPPFSV